jgi:5'-nucleotidase
MKTTAQLVAPPGRGIYCNRTLNLRSIEVIGYDMDYTLVHYQVEDWERHAFEHIRLRLAKDGWPVEDTRFDPELVMRGLVIDTELGNLLLTNRFGYVKKALHGTQPMRFDAVRASYLGITVDLANPRFRFLNTLFALSEGTMYAQCVDKLDRGEIPEEHMGYRALYERVRDSVDAAHTEGELKAEIMRRPQDFVELEEDTVVALLDQRRAGKRLMLITNSGWIYTREMMRYSFDRFLPPDTTWRDLFEVSICAARKPRFFESSAPLLKVVNEDGLLQPQSGKLELNGCYFGGNALELEHHLGVSGDQILYCGDHVFGDVRVSKALLRWRTALILRELEEELAAVERTRDVQHELAELMREKEEREQEHYHLRLLLQRLRLQYGPQPDCSEEELKAEMSQLRSQLMSLDEQISPIARRAATAHNKHWGLLLRAGNDKSRLARQIERHADVYTSRVSNFMFTTPFAYLRSPRGSLPHDPVPSRALIGS